MDKHPQTTLLMACQKPYRTLIFAPHNQPHPGLVMIRKSCQKTHRTPAFLLGDCGQFSLVSMAWEPSGTASPPCVPASSKWKIHDYFWSCYPSRSIQFSSNEPVHPTLLLQAALPISTASPSQYGHSIPLLSLAAGVFADAVSTYPLCFTRTTLVVCAHERSGSLTRKQR